MIAVTGTPGTGKTLVAREVAKHLRLPLIEVNALVKEKKLYTHVDHGSLVTDLARLKRALRGFAGVAEGHLLCEISLPAKVIVLRASPRTIVKRLAPRHYDKGKLKDNIEAEALDYCAIKARQHYARVIEVDTTGLTPAQSAAKALRYLRSGKSDRVDWSSYFLTAKA